MTQPCRSDCPSGDCAGCAFPPTTRTRCEPSKPCPQAETCALCQRLDRCSATIDGTVTWPADEGRCALFVDVRWRPLETAREAGLLDPVALMPMRVGLLVVRP